MVTTHGGNLIDTMHGARAGTLLRIW